MSGERGEQHQGAILELLLFAALEGQGIEVSDRTPDFRVGSGDERWDLEATSLTPDNFDMPRGLRTVVATIARELRSSDYFVNLSSTGSLASTPPSKERYLKPLRRLSEWSASAAGSWASSRRLGVASLGQRSA